MHPYYHALSSVKKFGGTVEDYIPIHSWFDETKSAFGDCRHRSMRHHSEGIFWCEEKFGITIKNSDGKMVPVRAIGEQHVIEDMGHIPSISDYLKEMKMSIWMNRVPVKSEQVLKEI